MRESSNGAAAANDSQVVVQVHNGSLQDLISPVQQSSDAKPVNIMIGSCTRFSREPASNRKLEDYLANGPVEEEA